MSFLVTFVIVFEMNNIIINRKRFKSCGEHSEESPYIDPKYLACIMDILVRNELSIVDSYKMQFQVECMRHVAAVQTCQSCLGPCHSR